MHIVAVLSFAGISPFHLAVPSLVFGAGTEEAPDLGYWPVVFAEHPGLLPTRGGYDIMVRHGVEAVDNAGTIVIPSWDRDQPVPNWLVTALVRAHRRGVRLVSLCLGAYVLAATGLADGQDLTVHWHAADDMRRRYPRVRVRSDVLWTDSGSIISSAGTVAALDTCLHVVRSDHGAAAAAELARQLVMAPHREGTQAQFVTSLIAVDERGDAVSRAMAWASGRLAEPIDLDQWSAQASTTRRTFTRKFRERTGESPGSWLLRRRLELARTLLETTDLTVDVIARRSGLGSGPTLRRHFRSVLGTSPRRHRDQFAVRTLRAGSLASDENLRGA